jgi:hypothetical protein
MAGFFIEPLFSSGLSFSYHVTILLASVRSSLANLITYVQERKLLLTKLSREIKHTLCAQGPVVLGLRFFEISKQEGCFFFVILQIENR